MSPHTSFCLAFPRDKRKRLCFHTAMMENKILLAGSALSRALIALFSVNESPLNVVEGTEGLEKSVRKPTPEKPKQGSVHSSETYLPEWRRRIEEWNPQDHTKHTDGWDPQYDPSVLHQRHPVTIYHTKSQVNMHTLSHLRWNGLCSLQGPQGNLCPMPPSKSWRTMAVFCL